MGTARERREKRRQQTQETAEARPRENRQVKAASDGKEPPFKFPINLPFNIPFNRWWLLLPAALILALGLIAILRAINPPEEVVASNAIWLDRTFSYSAPTDNELSTLIADWKTNEITTIYLYASSLKEDASWSGVVTQTNRFMEVEPLVASLLERLNMLYPEAQILAWMEVVADLPIYRLDSPQVKASVKDFAGRMVNGLKFDGIMLDVKPVFEGNEDLPVLLREVRDEIGLDRPLAVAVPADLTPTGTTLNLPTFIAANTVWSAEYKKRVSIQADQIVVIAYNSYLTDPVDYINWVAYQVQAFTVALENSPSQLFVSIPNYTATNTSDFPPHDNAAETMAGALDGIAVALRGLPADEFARFDGVAIYTDHMLSESEWRILQQKYLNAVLRPVASE